MADRGGDHQVGCGTHHLHGMVLVLALACRRAAVLRKEYGVSLHSCQPWRVVTPLAKAEEKKMTYFRDGSVYVDQESSSSSGQQTAQGSSYT